MQDLIALIRANKWHMTLDYIPSIDKFVCQLDNRMSGMGETMELAMIAAIERMRSI